MIFYLKKKKIQLKNCYLENIRPSKIPIALHFQNMGIFRDINSFNLIWHEPNSQLPLER